MSNDVSWINFGIVVVKLHPDGKEEIVHFQGYRDLPQDLDFDTLKGQLISNDIIKDDGHIYEYKLANSRIVKAYKRSFTVGKMSGFKKDPVNIVGQVLILQHNFKTITTISQTKPYYLSAKGRYVFNWYMGTNGMKPERFGQFECDGDTAYMVTTKERFYKDALLFNKSILRAMRRKKPPIPIAKQMNCISEKNKMRFIYSENDEEYFTLDVDHKSMFLALTVKDGRGEIKTISVPEHQRENFTKTLFSSDGVPVVEIKNGLANMLQIVKRMAEADKSLPSGHAVINSV